MGRKESNQAKWETPIVTAIWHNLYYSKTCIKRPLKNRQNKGLNDKW